MTTQKRIAWYDSHGKKEVGDTWKTIVKPIVKQKYLKKQWWSEQMQLAMKKPESNSENQWWNEQKSDETVMETR